MSSAEYSRSNRTAGNRGERHLSLGSLLERRLEHLALPAGFGRLGGHAFHRSLHYKAMRGFRAMRNRNGGGRAGAGSARGGCRSGTRRAPGARGAAAGIGPANDRRERASSAPPRHQSEARRQPTAPLEVLTLRTCPNESSSPGQDRPRVSGALSIDSGVRPSNRRDNHRISCCAPVMSVAALGDGRSVSRARSR